MGERRHNRGISAIMQHLDKMPFPFHASGTIESKLKELREGKNLTPYI